MNLDQYLLPYQKTFVDDPRKYKLFLSTRQGGKSFCLSYMAVKEVLTSPRGGSALVLCISTGARASSEFLKKVAQMAEAVKVLTDGQITYMASADKVEFSSGQRIISLPSGNPSALRGYTAQVVIIDEAAFVENPEDVMQAIGPALTRDKNAKLVLASTPAGKNSWFYRTYLKALDDPEWYVQTTTIEDAKRMGLDVDIEGLRQLCPDPDMFQQEYMCVFSSEYSSFIDTTLLEFSEEPRAKVVASFMGADIGSTGDRTAIADIAELEDGSYFVRDVTVLHKAEYRDQLETMKALYEKNGWSSGLIDANGIGNPIAEFANKNISARITGFTWTASNKTPSYENTRSLVFDRKLVFSEHLRQLVVSDFQNVSRIVTEAGVVKYVAGRDANGHSDVTSAIVLGLLSAKKAPACF